MGLQESPWSFVQTISNIISIIECTKYGNIYNDIIDCELEVFNRNGKTKIC